MSFKGELAGLPIESPFGNAGGVVKSMDDAELIARTGVGWIEAGSYTLEERIGNAFNPETGQLDRVVYYHDVETGTTVNALGMPNKGMDHVVTEIPEMVKIAHAHNKPLFVNVAPVSSDPVAETAELVRRAYEAGADRVIVNGGCPNVVTADGGRHEVLTRSEEGLQAVLTNQPLVRAVERYGGIGLRPTPLGNKVETIARVVRRSGVVSVVFTPNTWPGKIIVKSDGSHVLEVPGGAGGASGPAYAAPARQEAAAWHQALVRRNVDVVQSSGVMRATTIRRALKMGIAATAGTTFFYEANEGWQLSVDRMLSELAA